LHEKESFCSFESYTKSTKYQVRWNEEQDRKTQTGQKSVSVKVECKPINAMPSTHELWYVTLPGYQMEERHV